MQRPRGRKHSLCPKRSKKSHVTRAEGKKRRAGIAGSRQGQLAQGEREVTEKLRLCSTHWRIVSKRLTWSVFWKDLSDDVW